MQLIDPTVTTSTDELIRAPALTTLDNCTIGILSNGKLNADRLLHETAKLFEASHGCEVSLVTTKQNASAPAPDHIMAAPRADRIAVAPAIDGVIDRQNGDDIADA